MLHSFSPQTLPSMPGREVLDTLCDLDHLHRELIKQIHELVQMLDKSRYSQALDQSNVLN